MDFHFYRLDGEGLTALIDVWNKQGTPVVLDIETTGLDRFTDRLISFQLCPVGFTTAYYIEAEHAHLLARLSVPLVLHNFKFDFAFLRQQANVDLRYLDVPGDDAARRRTVSDTMLMHHLLDENADHSLDAIVKERWNDDYKERFWATHKSFDEAAADEQLDYACRDVVYTGLLYNALLSELLRAGVPDSLVEHTHALALALYATEVQGLRVELDYLLRVGEQLKTRIASHESVLRAAAPLEVDAVEMARWEKELSKRKTPRGKAGVKRPSFNWASGDDLQALIYGELGVKPVVKWSKAKRQRVPTLDDAALEELEDAHPVIKGLRDYREDAKVFGSFIEGTLERHRGGRVYPSFHVNGTVTGRISSADPNLQQLPRDGGIRGIYVPDDGHLLVSCDYAQLEVVVAAHYSQDPALLRIIKEGASKHDITAEGLGIERQLAKRINFALGYGAGKWKIKSILGCSERDAEDALRRYWETYAGEKKVIDECQKRVDDGLPIVSMFGRQRHFPQTFAKDSERQRAYRQAYNSLVQGTGSDICHRAFYTCADAFASSKLGRALFEVHDEILVEASSTRVEEAREALTRIMLEAGKVLSVPLGVDCGEGMARWEKG